MTRQNLRTLITFDVSDNRIRYRVVKALRAHAQRVQKSVFECPELPPASYLRLRSKLEGRIDPDTDSLRYYRLCAACVGRIEHFGADPGLLDVPEEFVIIEP